MSAPTNEAVEAALKDYVEPHLGRDLVSTKSIKSIDIEGDQVKVKVTLGFPAKGAKDAKWLQLSETQRLAPK